MWWSRGRSTAVRSVRRSVVAAVVVVGIAILIGSARQLIAHPDNRAQPAHLSAVVPNAVATEGGEGPSEPQTPAIVVVHPGKTAHLVMANAAGFTLYAFSIDRPGNSQCRGACARRWRPAVSSGGKPQAGAGVSLPSIGSMLRPDGSFQVTFNGLPVYYFVEDRNPFDENGANRKEFGGVFSPVPPIHKPH